MSVVKSRVLCHSSSVLLFTHGALESKSHQQLGRCMAATVSAAVPHINSPMQHSLSPLLHANYTSAPAPGDTDYNDYNRNAGTCLSETSEVCP